ncbi:MAG: alpha/beta hydrolase [Bacillales bacterium]|jgi:pimeloyl-ACP methyl ester carboxylesterase|nr:alpha/beta hydrolase [Bacillales bacterium]
MNKKSIKLSKEIISYYDEGEGPLILLIHGNTSSSYFYVPLIEKLRVNHRVIAPDLRGYGDSSYNHRFDTLKELAEDIYELLKALKLEKLVVVGWSLGGGVALELVANHLEVASHLFLLNSTTYKGFPLFMKDEKGQQIIGKAYQTKEEMANDPINVAPMLNIIASKNKQFMDFILKKSIYTVNEPEATYQEQCVEECLKQRSLVDSDWAISRINMGSEPSAYSLGSNTIQNITIPTYVTQGDKDLLVSETMVNDNVLALKAKKIVYSPCGHSPIVDCLDLVYADILELEKA